MGFLGNLFGAHTQRVTREVTDAIIRADPTTASQAQLVTMEQDLDRAGLLIGRLRTEYAREQREADAAVALFNTHVAAADRLHAQLTAEADAERVASLSRSLDALLTMVQSDKDDRDREVAEAEDAKALLDEAEGAYRDKASGLRTAKDKLSSGVRAMEHAKIREQAAQEQAERAAEVAGLRQDRVGGLNSALDAMQRITDASTQRADSSRMKAQELRRPMVGGSDDPNIVEALRVVNQSPAQVGDFSERLAALTGRTASPALSGPRQKSSQRAT